MEFLPVRCDALAYEEYLALFASSFGHVGKYTSAYLDWLYRRNPDGQVVGFDARDGDRLAAHYVCTAARASVGGQEVRVLLSLNTATHPDYQGRGLFTKLAEKTYAAGAASGYDAVYGIANANSTPGFTRKLGFQLVMPLRACVGIGGLGIDHSRIGGVGFRRRWSAQALAWRCENPSNTVRVRHATGRTVFLAPALLRGACQATAELQDVDAPAATAGFASPLRLFIGVIPPQMQGAALYADIPARWRPSPLNMIYRSLSGRVGSIDSQSVYLNFLDFDAY